MIGGVYLSSVKAIWMLNLPENALANRGNGSGSSHVEVCRCVRYRRSDLEMWLDAGRCASTATCPKPVSLTQSIGEGHGCSNEEHLKVDRDRCREGYLICLTPSVSATTLPFAAMSRLVGSCMLRR